MGKRIKLQRRGKGTPRFRSTIHAKVDIRYLPSNELIKGEVIDMFTDPVRSAPVGEILLSNNKKTHIICAEGMMTGQTISFGEGAEQVIGNVLRLSDINTGTNIYNIENNFGDGGKFVRASGQYAILVNKKDKAIVKMPSGKLKTFPLTARATIGVIAGGGRKTKPYVKAGNKFKAMKARGHPYPVVRGVAMNAVDHPFGGSQHHVGHSKSTARGDPAGRKVGSIAAKRSGRKKK